MEDKKPTELLETIEAQEKTIQELEKKVQEFEQAKLEKERLALVEKLVSEKGLSEKEFEGKKIEVLEELYKVLPNKEKVEPKSKGVVEEKEEPEVKEDKDIFEVTEGGDLTLSHKGWENFDKQVRSFDWIEKEVRWMPTKNTKKEAR